MRALEKSTASNWRPLRLAMASGDTRRAADVVTATLASSLDLSDSQVSTMAARAWLREYGPNAARQNPDQLLELALGLTQLGKPEVEGWLTRIEEAHPDPDPYLRACLHGSSAEYHLARGNPERALPHNQLASGAIPEATRVHPLFAVLPVQRARGFLMSGDVDSVITVLESTSLPVGVPIVDEVRLPALRAWVALQQGELRLAGRIAKEVVDTPRNGAPHHTASGSSWPPLSKPLSTSKAEGSSPPSAGWVRPREPPRPTGRPDFTAWSRYGGPGWPRPKATRRPPPHT